MKEKQIEEMAKLFCDFCHEITKEKECCYINEKENYCFKNMIGQATKLYNAGYRKIDKDSVVLTNDNAEELANLIVTSPQMQSVMSNLIKAWQKEAVEKILEMAGDIPVKDSNYVHDHDLLAWLEKIAKEFDVKKEWL